MKPIHERLQELRDRLDMTRQAFASRIGIDQGTYSRYELGQTKPSFDTLGKLALCFPQVNSTWLLTGKGEMMQDSSVPLVLVPPTGLAVSQSPVSEAERLNYWKQLAEERGRLLEKAEERENRLWEQLGKPLGNQPAAKRPKMKVA